MIRNCNDGSNREPYLRLDISMGNLEGLPSWSKGPKGSPEEVLSAIKAAGFQGVQGGDIAIARQLGLGVTAGGRLSKPGEADDLARQQKDAGVDCLTLHVGWGLEDDSALFAYVEEVLNASSKYKLPIYIETHRATITQDPWRTLQIIKRFPEIRFNGDFSHWYTGSEMVYGGLDWKFDLLSPVFDRVRFVHGRISHPGAMQASIGDGENYPQKQWQPYVDHFRDIWTRCFTGFLRSAQPGDYICFTPELLPGWIFYAHLAPDSQGNLAESTDRWEEAILLAKIARGCFAQAGKNLQT